MQEFTLKETAQWLQNCEDAHILIHRSPDGDCIGSGYALAEALRQMGKRAAVLCSDPIPERYQFLLPKETQQIFSPKWTAMRSPRFSDSTGTLRSWPFSTSQTSRWSSLRRPEI